MKAARSSHRDLVTWQRGMDLVEAVYRLSAGFPQEERFGLTAQVRRAAISVPSNIAEGHGRNSSRDFLRFLGIARGSLREVETQLELAARLGLADRSSLSGVISISDEVGRTLNGLMSSLRIEPDAPSDP